MKYAIMTAKHHEGFTLFNSKHPYSLNNPVTGGTNISPQGRDLAGEFARAFRDKGLKVGFYYSLVDWQHPHAYEFVLPGYPKDDTPRQYEQYVDYLHQHTRELITGYGPIDIFWCDFSSKRFEGSKWQTRRLLQMLRKHQPQILVNNRFWNGIENRKGDFATPEKYVPPTGIPGLDWGLYRNCTK